MAATPAFSPASAKATTPPASGSVVAASSCQGASHIELISQLLTVECEVTDLTSRKSALQAQTIREELKHVCPMEVDAEAISGDAMMDSALAMLMMTRLSLASSDNDSRAVADTKFAARVGADARFIHAKVVKWREREAWLKANAMQVDSGEQDEEEEEDVVMGDAEEARRKSRKQLEEMRLLIGAVRRKRSRRLRERALAKVEEERVVGPRWEHFSLRNRWKAGEIGT